MKRFLLIIAAAFSLAAYANSENAPQTTDGAFTTLMIAAADIGKYTETLRNNLQPFKLLELLEQGFVLLILVMSMKVK